MLKSVEKAKRNPVEGVTTFYVRSRSNPKQKHMVVRFALPNPLLICQCNDSFGRRLPHMGQNTYSHCWHASRVKKAFPKG